MLLYDICVFYLVFRKNVHMRGGKPQCIVRLALTSILNAKHANAMVLMAVVCGSWTVINQGTSGRHVTHPMGREGLEYIKEANVMVCRQFVFYYSKFLLCV